MYKNIYFSHPNHNKISYFINVINNAILYNKKIFKIDYHSSFINILNIFLKNNLISGFYTPIKDKGYIIIILKFKEYKSIINKIELFTKNNYTNIKQYMQKNFSKTYKKYNYLLITDSYHNLYLCSVTLFKKNNFLNKYGHILLGIKLKSGNKLVQRRHMPVNNRYGHFKLK